MKELQSNEIENINGGTWGQAINATIGSLTIAAGAAEVIGGIATLDPIAGIAGVGDIISGASQL